MKKLIFLLIFCSMFYSQETLKLDNQNFGYGILLGTLSNFAVNSYYAEHEMPKDCWKILTPMITTAVGATMIQAYEKQWNWDKWGSMVIGGFLSTMVIKVAF